MSAEAFASAVAAAAAFAAAAFAAASVAAFFFASAAAVFQSADGTRTIAEITQAVATQLDGSFDEDLTWTALEELDGNGLLEAPLPPRSRGLTRRRLLAVGAAVPLVPVVLAITAPTPAFAASVPSGSTGAPGPTGPGGSTAG